MKLPVYKIDGTQSGKKIDLNKHFFGIEPNDDSIYYAVLAERTHSRQDTHNAKNRSAVHGGGRKPFRQKGTGRARQGTIREPQMRGGGVAFPPHPHKHNYKISKKIKDLAKRSSLSYKFKENKIKIVEDFDFEEPKTKKMVDILKAMELDSEKTLLLTEKTSQNLLKSCRNIVKLKIREFKNSSTYDILNSNLLLIQKSAIESLNKAEVKDE